MMIITCKPFEEHAADFAWCEEVIKTNSKSFYRAFSLLPYPKRESVYALYTFCRAADDCVDRYASKEALDSLEQDLVLFFEGHVPESPLWRSLAVVFETFDLEKKPFFDMIEGQRRDLAFKQPETLVELEEYGYYVAGSVGLMLLPILHARSAVTADLKQSAIDLGVAMQITNILRDVGEDLDNGRIYLPCEAMADVRYSSFDLENRLRSKAFVTLWETLAHRSEELYLPMQRDAVLLDEDSRLATLSSLFLYRGILDEVRRQEYQCLTKRSVVPKDQAYLLITEAEALLSSPRDF
ncbi:MAG: phytoene/squalene synthase family protein, partial [Raoultibacter sp.]